MNKQKLYDLEQKNMELVALLEKIECVTFYQGSQLTGMPRCNKTSDKVATTACELAEYDIQLTKALKEVKDAQDEALEELKNVEGILYDVLFYKFIYGMNWKQVARETGKTEQAVRQVYCRF